MARRPPLRRSPPAAPHDAPAGPRPTPGVLYLTSIGDVQDLIADLRLALRRSRRTGGSYTVVRLDDQRRPLLQVDVHIPFGERSPR